MVKQTIIIGIIAVALIAVVGGIYWIFFTAPPIEVGDWSANGSATSTPGDAPPAGYRDYRNEAYRFALYYPEDLIVEEYPEEGGALSVTFQDEAREKGFQIYVTPYTGTQITEERFLLDDPSGVRDEMQDVLIAGARATIFFGKSSVIGNTREAWFIHNGFLYEVTTYKELDAWLAGIMQTWRFL